MSLHFSANQYEQAFDPMRLQNWEIPQVYRARPRSFQGFTQIVASDRGHLLPGVKRSRESPWGTFIGTWDMPTRIPGNTNPTARTEGAVYKLERIKSSGDIVLSGKLKKCKLPSPLPVKEDIKADKEMGPAPPAAQLDPSKTSSNRSGARAPEPQTSAQLSPPPLAQGSKPQTPNIDWPRPASVGRVKSASPKAPLPPISPKPVESPPPGQSARTPINWPSPKEPEQQKI